jgi:hypothetical protein
LQHWETELLAFLKFILRMSNLTELLNQIDRWVWQCNSNAAVMSPGLPLSEIQTKLDLLPFELPSEVIELYQWRNGGQYSFLPCPEGGYDLQNFLSLDDAISIAQDLNRAKSTYDFPLFYLEDILYWTQGSSEKQELAVIYCHHNSSKPDYPSLTAMMEKELERLRTIWPVD